MSTIASAVLLGVGVLLAGNLLWAPFLAPLNLRFLPGVPWAIVPMAIYLGVYWAFISGAIGASDSAATRQESLRARQLPPSVWAAAIVTGLIGFAAVLALTAVMARLIVMPVSQIVTPPAMPAVTAIALLAMASVVAGVTEEAAFRGYMQSPIERQYGLAVAILVNGAVFGLLHFPTHPGAVVVMLPYYIAVAAVYSGLTWATNSILPAVALHVGGDIWSLVRLWATGKAEWQRSDTVQTLVWDAGLDASFLSAVGLCAAFSIGTFALCRQLRRFAITLPSERPSD
jgi:membrane protease YdiL (CAAX protease family)